MFTGWCRTQNWRWAPYEITKMADRTELGYTTWIDPGSGAPGPHGCDKCHGRSLPLDSRHQCTGGRSDQGGTAGGAYLDAVPPICLLATGEVREPLPASPYGLVGMVARVGSGPGSGALRTPVGAELPAGPQPAPGLVHQRPAATPSPPHAQPAHHGGVGWSARCTATCG